MTTYYKMNILFLLHEWISISSSAEEIDKMKEALEEENLRIWRREEEQEKESFPLRSTQTYSQSSGLSMDILLLN